ncbi:MAG: biosynthetic-type acetolactate synthase large subunit [Candidatus Sumerlaeota bacterium]|nr:biosynthetic-type acetolactate synthase large subunit [Candidatus Sumerlaeota bacterium]
MSITGAQIIVDALEREGVVEFFCFPGGAVLDLCDAIAESKILKPILVRHEQGAGHMADGYARSSGRPGVLLVTSGPGATNIVTALANAYMDSVPVVALTGQVPTAAIGNDAFQEADIVGITRPCTKHNYLVKNVADLGQTIKEAFYIATTGKPGPVLIDIPKDVQQAKLEDYSYPETADIRSYKPTTEGNPRQIVQAARIIERSKKPVIYAGGGAIVANAANLILALAEKCDIPVTTTLLGLGVFPETHPLALKMVGMHGTAYANHAVNECDCLITAGARFDDRVTGKVATFAPHCRGNIIHIDIDPSAISKSVPADCPIVGDCGKVLTALLAEIKPCRHPEWIAECDAWKKQFPLGYDREGAGLRPQYVIEELYKFTGGDAIVATEVGQHQMWAAQFWTSTRPRRFLSSGGLGTMGYGLPAAIGAQVANPDQLVVNIAGDGSIQMNAQEFTTAALNHLPVKTLILNNRYLGMVRQWQQLFYGRRYTITPLNRAQAKLRETDAAADENLPPYLPDFVKLADAHGCVGLRVSRKEDVRGAFEEMIKVRRPVIIDFWVEQEENVFPMIPAGKGVKEMIASHEDYTRGLA